jgi:hypothetical protein
MRGGADTPSDPDVPVDLDLNESAILPVKDEEVHNLYVGEGEGEGPPDFDDESNGPLNMSDLQDITRDSGEISVDTGLSESNPNFSTMSSFSMGQPEGEEEEEKQSGGKKKKRRKGKKTQKRRVKKGGELPIDYNPNDREDLDHN